MSERVACSACGKWMFHRAKTCPHCRAERQPGAVEKVEISAEEARALLAVAAPSAEPRLKDVAAELVLHRGGLGDFVLSVVALPLTGFTLVVLGYGVYRAMRRRRAFDLRGARLFSVPVATGFASLLLLQRAVSAGVWVGLGVSFAAWLVREVLRARARA